MAPSVLLDRIGATGSFACALHCALLPAAIILVPSVGSIAWLGEGSEQGLVVFASALGIAMSLWNRVRHRRGSRVWPLLLGLGALWTGALWPAIHEVQWLHAATMSVGGTMMGVTHWFNLHRHGDRKRRRRPKPPFPSSDHGSRAGGAT